MKLKRLDKYIFNLTIVALTLLTLTLFLSLIDAFALSGLAPEEVMPTIFINFGNIFNFAQYQGATNIFFSVLAIVILFGSLFAGFWIVLLVLKKNTKQIIAVVLFVLTSVIFSFYLANFPTLVLPRFATGEILSILTLFVAVIAYFVFIPLIFLSFESLLKAPNKVQKTSVVDENDDLYEYEEMMLDMHAQHEQQMSEVREEVIESEAPQTSIIINNMADDGTMQSIEIPQKAKKTTTKRTTTTTITETDTKEMHAHRFSVTTGSSKDRKPLETFAFKMANASQEIRDTYNEVKSELLSWGLKSRISSSGDTFRISQKIIAKITLTGKSLKLNLALDPSNYENNSTVEFSLSPKKSFQDIPFTFRLNSVMALKKAAALIRDLCLEERLIQSKILKHNHAQELSALKAPPSS